MTRRVLVTGGTGKTGGLLGEQLAQRHVEARVATRHPKAPQHVRFDWRDPSTHEAALAGAEGVYLVAPSDTTDPLSVMRPFLERALGHGPLVLLSASSLEEGGALMGQVHAWLRAHAPHWVVLRPSWFMQNFTTQLLPAIRAEGCLYTATQEGRVPFLDAADIARVAAEALLDPKLASRELLLTGPEALTYDEAAERVASVAGFPVRHVRLTVAQLAERYRGFGLAADYAQLLAGMDAAIARGSEDRTTPTVAQISGRAPNELAHYLATQRRVFAA